MKGMRRGKGMGLFDRIINNVANSASRSLGRAIGDGVGNAIGDAASKLGSQAVENVTTDMKVANEQKEMALDEQKKALNLPPICPHCGAPTSGKLVCEFCDCKVIQ